MIEYISKFTFCFHTHSVIRLHVSFRISLLVWFLAFSDAVRFNLGINGTQMV